MLGNNGLPEDIDANFSVFAVVDTAINSEGNRELLESLYLEYIDSMGKITVERCKPLFVCSGDD